MTARDVIYGRRGGRIVKAGPAPVDGRTGLPAGTVRVRCAVGHLWIVMAGDTSDCWTDGARCTPVGLDDA